MFIFISKVKSIFEICYNNIMKHNQLIQKIYITKKYLQMKSICDSEFIKRKTSFQGEHYIKIMITLEMILKKSLS